MLQVLLHQTTVKLTLFTSHEPIPPILKFVLRMTTMDKVDICEMWERKAFQWNMFPELRDVIITKDWRGTKALLEPNSIIWKATP